MCFKQCRHELFQSLTCERWYVDVTKTIDVEFLDITFSTLRKFRSVLLIFFTLDGEIQETPKHPNSRNRKGAGKGRNSNKRNSSSKKPVHVKEVGAHENQDGKIVLEGKKEGENRTKLFVHSSWLAVHSPYFKALFYSGMKETHSKEVVMRIHESELQAHLLLIEAMYKLDVLDDKDITSILEVLVLADKYDANLMFKKCKCVLISTPLSLETCEQTLNSVAEIPDCADVLDAVAAFLVKEFSPLDKTWTADKFLTLSQASLKSLLSNDKLVVMSENTVFVALMAWLHDHREEAAQDGRFFLSLVRFELMTPNFIYDIVRHDTMAKSLDGFHEFLLDGFAYHALPQSRINQLNVKPISRSGYTDRGPTFSWVIDQEEQRMLIEVDQIFSGLFWLQGYRMGLKLNYEKVSKKYSMYLYVYDLKEGHVEIDWNAKSDLFSKKVVCCKSCTYTTSSTGYGARDLQSNKVPSIEANTPSRIVEVWVHIS